MMEAVKTYIADIKSSSKRVRIILGSLVIIVVIAIGFSVNIYTDLSNLKNPEVLAKADLEKTVRAVSKLMVLPVGEEPTAATVSDPEKLRAQPFFAQALAGDKVLVYAESRKAILYRPSINRIIEVAPLGAETQ